VQSPSSVELSPVRVHATTWHPQTSWSGCLAHAELLALTSKLVTPEVVLLHDSSSVSSAVPSATESGASRFSTLLASVPKRTFFWSDGQVRGQFSCKFLLHLYRRPLVYQMGRASGSPQVMDMSTGLQVHVRTSGVKWENPCLPILIFFCVSPVFSAGVCAQMPCSRSLLHSNPC